MSDRHELLCEQYYDGGGYYCICDEIAQSRAEERARIVAVLDAMAGQATGLDIYSHAQRLVLDQLRRRLTEDTP